MYVVNKTNKLGIRELRDFIYQLLFDFYHIIPQFRRELRDCLVLQDKTTLSRWENINNNSKNKILYINRWSRPAQLILKQLINSTNSDSDFIEELNKIYERLSENSLY